LIIKNILNFKFIQNYLVDGFPRALDQAIYFEKNVVEASQILFYDVPQEIMLERCMKRAETSGRADDNAETIKTRVQNYFDQSLPVVEYYKMFGKVKHIDATGDIASVFAQTKASIIPQTMCVLGPKSSGKTTISLALCQRTNTKHVDFNTFLIQNGLIGQDDETVTAQLISSLSKEHMPRIVLENFPQNITQAKYFSRNGSNPSHIFTLNCSKDMCQERMIDLGQSHPNYVASSILSKKIKKYHDDCAELLPFLKSSSNLIEINTDQPLDKTMEEVYKNVEPLVIHIRPGASPELRNEIVEKLAKEHGFINLDVDKCMRGENERGTAIGLQLIKLVEQSKIIPGDLIVKMLKMIIYCGTPTQNKFILTNFPDMIEQAKEFE
jgi:adenylate kinase